MERFLPQQFLSWCIWGEKCWDSNRDGFGKVRTRHFGELPLHVMVMLFFHRMLAFLPNASDLPAIGYHTVNRVLEGYGGSSDTVVVTSIAL